MEGELKLGDSELILEHVARTRGKQLDAELSTSERARSHIVRRMMEEHYHQVFEYELFLSEPGFAMMKQMMAGSIPAPLRPLMVPMVAAGISPTPVRTRHRPAQPRRGDGWPLRPPTPWRSICSPATPAR